MDNLYYAIFSTLKFEGESLLNDDGVDPIVAEELTQKILQKFRLQECPYPTDPGWWWFYGNPLEEIGSEDQTRTGIYPVVVRIVGNTTLYLVGGVEPFKNFEQGRWAIAIHPLWDFE
jgi:hypothetical protein